MPESMPTAGSGGPWPAKRAKESNSSIKQETETDQHPPPATNGVNGLKTVKKEEHTDLNISMKSQEVLDFCSKLGHDNGKIATHVYEGSGGIPKSIFKKETPSQVPTTPLTSPSSPVVPLTTSELHPATPTIYVKSKDMAFSPQLFEMILHKPITLIRNVAAVCDIDLSMYSTKTLVQAHPSHPVEIRSQMEQDADENWEPTMTKQVWYCTSSRSHTTIAKYAEYQAQSLQETWESRKSKDVNPTFDFTKTNTRRMIKFGTNCDLSDEKKWGPQLKELLKLPAWSRVVSAGNMLSHVGHQILGMNTVQLYMKVPCARTPGHQENNNFCAVNLNIGPGDSEWFGVPNEYWDALENMCAKQNLSYLHGSWWPNFNELTAAGIPCYRFLQRPGDLVYVNAGCVHWVQATGWCNNIAWNVGPLTHRQYKVAMERYEWNKTQKYQSIVAMIFLTWNLARNVRVGDIRLHNGIKQTLLQSLRITVQTLTFAKEKGVKIKFHGRKRNEPANYCGVCEEEVFNTLFVKETEKKQYTVYCLSCARKIDPDLKGMICLKEYMLEELFEIYDKFEFERSPLEEDASPPTSPATSMSSPPPALASPV